jgi:hypothetical protein
MSWQSEMVIILRDMVFDTDPSSYTYTSSRLEQAIVNASYWVYTNLDFAATYNIDVEGVDITPDPTDEPVDYDFVILTCLRAAVLVLGSEMKTRALSAVRVTDGPSSIDMTAVAQHLKPLYDEAIKQFNNAKLAFQVGESGSGKAILSPYSANINMRYNGGSHYYGAR